MNARWVVTSKMAISHSTSHPNFVWLTLYMIMYGPGLTVLMYIMISFEITSNFKHRVSKNPMNKLHCIPGYKLIETDIVTSPDPQRTKTLMDQTLAKINTWSSLIRIPLQLPHTHSETLCATPSYGSDMDQQDETDSVTSPDPQRTKTLMDQTLAKIERTKEAMKAEQLAKDGKIARVIHRCFEATHLLFTLISRMFTVAGSQKSCCRWFREESVLWLLNVLISIRTVRETGVGGGMFLDHCRLRSQQ